MSTHRPAVLVLSLLAALAACSERPLPTAASPTRAPAFDFMNNPDISNPKIVRFETGDGWLISDDAGRRFTIFATTNREFGCARRTYRTWADVQQIMGSPDPEADAIHVLETAREGWITVYDGPFSPSLECADLAARKVAEGVGQWKYTDNDIYSFLRPNTNANAFGQMAQGKLELVGGGTAQFSAVSRCVWDGEDFGTLRCTNRVNLQ